MPVTYLFVLMCWCALPVLPALEMFTDADFAAGELDKIQEKQLYQKHFGEQDVAAAGDAVAQLKLAGHLRARYREPLFNDIRCYLLFRMQSLCAGADALKALEMRIFVLRSYMAECGVSHARRAALLDLLQKQFDHKQGVAADHLKKDIVAAHVEQAVSSIAAGQWQQALNDYQKLHSWLERIQDKHAAEFVAGMIGDLKQYIKRQHAYSEVKQKLESAAEDAPGNQELQRRAGRFEFMTGQWADAVAHLAGVDQQLAEIARLEMDEQMSLEQEAAVLFLIDDVLKQESVRADALLCRRLLTLAVQHQDYLNSQQDHLSPTMKMKYGIAAGKWSWRKQLEQLGQDVRTGFIIPAPKTEEPVAAAKKIEQIADGHWDDLLDQELQRNEDGHVALNQNGPGFANLTRFDDFSAYRAIKLRFQFIDDSGKGWFTVHFNQKQDQLRLCIEDDRLYFSKSFNNDSAPLTLKSGWNEAVIVWHDAQASLTVNGQTAEQTLGLSQQGCSGYTMAIGDGGEMDMRISAIEGLRATASSEGYAD